MRQFTDDEIILLRDLLIYGNAGKLKFAESQTLIKAVRDCARIIEHEREKDLQSKS